MGLLRWFELDACVRRHHDNTPVDTVNKTLNPKPKPSVKAYIGTRFAGAKEATVCIVGPLGTTLGKRMSERQLIIVFLVPWGLYYNHYYLTPWGLQFWVCQSAGFGTR